MPIAALLTFVLVLGWFLLDSPKTKNTIKIHFFVGIFAIWGAYLFIKLGDWHQIENRYFYLIFVPIFALLLRKVYKTGKKTTIEIVAKQQNYWGISPKNIYDYYKDRVDKKDDRIEIKVDTSAKQLTSDNDTGYEIFSGNIKHVAKSLQLTKIANIDEIKKFQLYLLVFQKIDKILKYMEKNINFEDVLKENDMCAEYFLMDLWEKFTQNFNIGTANLETYATNDIQKEFIGALDSVSLNSVKRSGSALLYSFMKFKNRLPNSDQQNNL